MKNCCHCKTLKPASEFYFRKGSAGDLQHRCKECDKRKAKDYRIANKDKVAKGLREWHKRNPAFKVRQRLKKYGITLEQFDALSAAQGNACAICRKPFSGKGQVDHCHTTQKVRGLLCIPCNLGIGHLQENPDIFRAAIAYLSAHH